VLGRAARRLAEQSVLAQAQLAICPRQTSGRMKPMRRRVPPTLHVDRVLNLKAIGPCLRKERNTDQHLLRLDGRLSWPVY
jgi:hypothetical protein